MKKYYSVILGLCFVLGIASCSNFLNVTPKNVISMDDMESIKTSLAGFLYKVRDNGNGEVGSNLPWSPFLMPQVSFIKYTEEWDLSSYAENDLTESEIKTIDWKSESTQSLWNNFYAPIGFMNLIIHEAETAEGEESMRDYVMGEAYMIRAYCFFKLIQYFAPYHNNELGIPICLESYEDFEKITLERKTQNEVYKQILSDLKEAGKRLERTHPRETYNVMYSSKVLNRLYAKIYHFKALSAAGEDNDWKEAVNYANRETEDKVLESDPVVLKKFFDIDISEREEHNDYGLRFWAYSSYSMYSAYNIDVNKDFYRDYFSEDNDIRKSIFYVETKNSGSSELQIKMNKYSQIYNSWGNIFIGLRLPEMFLIQAEAYAMTDHLLEAKEVLRRFKSARYTDGAFTIPESKEDVLKDIYRERRKEFVAEDDICWLDMKRLGLKMERKIAGITFTLEGANDYRYAFPIPLSEINNNKYIEQNPGWTLND